ncbi:MAG TPA: universal stress protein [Jatrophihabitantaceae bacterium]|nr:universal stress protein [Jatrophihabitantaceae bacterium]
MSIPPRPGPVLVGVNDERSTELALRWAIADARTLGVAVKLVHAFSGILRRQEPMYRDIPDADLQQPRHVAEQLVATLVDQAREIDPDVVVCGDAIEGSSSRVLVQEASSATELVVGSRHLAALRSAVLGSVAVAATGRTACPMIVVRGPAGLPEEGAGVVVGVDTMDRAQSVLAVAFDHASRHQVPLRPVLCWHPDLLASMKWRSSPPAPERAEMWLSEALAGWRERYPDVAVHPEVIREHPVAGLVLASSGQYLLLVGTTGHHGLPGALLGSVSQGVLYRATCPVAVVPTHLS